MTAPAWPPEKIGDAAILWREGLSAAKIGKVFGVSRSAICGLANRNRNLFPKRPRLIGIQNQRDAARAQHDRRRASGWVSKAARGYIVPPPTVVDVSFARPWLERKYGQCAYPISGEGADAFSCCAPSGQHRYCAGHRAVMFVPPKESIQRIARWAA